MIIFLRKDQKMGMLLIYSFCDLQALTNPEILLLLGNIESS